MLEEKFPKSLVTRVVTTVPTKWREFQFIQNKNFKDLLQPAKARLINSMVSNQFSQPFYVWKEESTGIIYCLDGKHRTAILLELADDGMDIPDELPATFIQCDSKQEAAKLVLMYSSIFAKTTEQGLFDFMQEYDLSFEELKTTIDLPEFDEIEFSAKFLHTDPLEVPHLSLAERFIIPPFSVFDTRQGYWQERKKQWHALGFNSQETREDVELVAESGQSPAIYELRNKMRKALGRDPEWSEIITEAKKRGLHLYEGASIFDPVVAEVCYKWFCPDNAMILDPFAGGSVRGIVASILGHDYYGIDLRTEQVNANRKQAEAICKDHQPTWFTGDSYNIIKEMSVEKFDFIFSCPPYHDLEKYSDDPADLSNMSYEDFLAKYETIIFNSLMKLKLNRFACFVVADIRDEKGLYRNFVSETINAFKQPLCDGIPVNLYNEIILLNVAGSLPVRIAKQFANNRKVGKIHQNILVFYKGDPKKNQREFS